MKTARGPSSLTWASAGGASPLRATSASTVSAWSVSAIRTTSGLLPGTRARPSQRRERDLLGPCRE
eukprot:9069051-Pyramimonas_sp.AAC.1